MLHGPQVQIQTFIFGIAFLILLSSSPLAADESKQVFDALFAAKLKAVNATPDRADDVALASELLVHAKSSKEQLGLLTLICDSAYDLGLRSPEGQATAIEAQMLLAQHVESKRSEAQEKVVALLTRQASAGKAEERDAAGASLVVLLITMGDEKMQKSQFAEAAADFRRAVAAGSKIKGASVDEVKSKLELAARLDRTIKNIARLDEKLLENANDAASAQEIVRHYLVDLNDAASALPYLNRIKDDQLKQMTLLAAKPVSELNEDESLTLGEWYVSQIKPPALGAVVSHAEKCLVRFLALHPANDLPRTKATALLKTIRAIPSTGSTEPRFVKLVNVRSKLELALEGGFKDENVRTIQWHNTGAATNVWEIIPVPLSKAVRLKNKHSGKFLCVLPGELHVLQRSEPSKAGGDHWLIERTNTADHVMLRSVLLKNVLAVSGANLKPGGYIIHWKAGSGDEQKWQMIDDKPAKPK